MALGSTINTRRKNLALAQPPGVSTPVMSAAAKAAKTKARFFKSVLTSDPAPDFQELPEDEQNESEML
jgi:hypothetical protein